MYRKSNFWPSTLVIIVILIPFILFSGVSDTYAKNDSWPEIHWPSADNAIFGDLCVYKIADNQLYCGRIQIKKVKSLENDWREIQRSPWIDLYDYYQKVDEALQIP
jgi:hypothetical protein